MPKEYLSDTWEKRNTNKTLHEFEGMPQKAAKGNPRNA